MSQLTWQDVIGKEKQAPYFAAIMSQLRAEKAAGKTIYPPPQDLFNAFRYTSFAALKVVILGQDPYHGPNQAHGLCFSVKAGIAFPPSLRNIFQELQDDVNIDPPKQGCLESWAKQGVLLLNTVLSVEAGQAHSHAKLGWERFTDAVMSAINMQHNGVVFLLWGAHAQRKGQIIDEDKHYVLRSVHPSPLSAHRGFMGCRHFSKTNALLQQQGKSPIDWNVDG